MKKKNVIMEILKRDEIILMYSSTKAAGRNRMHQDYFMSTHTQEIILKINSGEIRLFQVGSVNVMNGCKKIMLLF